MTSLSYYTRPNFNGARFPQTRGRYRLATRQISNAAMPHGKTMSEPRRYLNAVLMLALGQCARDLMTEFSNLPGIHGRFMAEKAEIGCIFAQQRKVLLRGVSKDEAKAFEDVVCEVTDMCERRTEWLVATVRDELSGKLTYTAVMPGAMLGIIHGLCQCCNRLNQIMTGRKTSCYTQVMEELLLIDGKLDQHYLNSDITPDFERIEQAIIATCKDMQEATMQVLGLKRKEGGER